jgi:hypothetical protein
MIVSGVVLLLILILVIVFAILLKKHFYVDWSKELDAKEGEYKIDQYLPEQSDMTYDRYIIGVSSYG